MPIPLRPDFDAGQLRRIARESEDAKQVRRLLARISHRGQVHRRSESAKVLLRQSLVRCPEEPADADRV